MARPFREQFVVATFVLLVPLVAVVTWGANLLYSAQIEQMQQETRLLASAVAAHVNQSNGAGDGDLTKFLNELNLTDAGMGIQIVDDMGHVIAGRPGAYGVNEEQARATVRVSRQPWTVVVVSPTSVAWLRVRDVSRQALLVAAVATLLMVLLEALFVRRLMRALARFELAADRVGSGDLRTPASEPMPSRELERLRDGFIGMVDNLREARAAIALQVEEERRMRDEVGSLQQQIIRQERLAAIGVLLSGIAHELNNPLQTISGFAELLQRDKGLSGSQHDDVAIIKKESVRASAIIRNLSRFSRQQGASPALVYLRDVVGSVVELRNRRFAEINVALEIDDQAVQPVLAVFSEMQQVVLNFVINAEQAMIDGRPTGRVLVIRTSDEGDDVRLEVEDTGPGVRPEDEAKLFQPFFTTKPVGEGTGLGLSVSYGIIRSFAGRIGYQRGAKGGACFYFHLPAHAVEARPRVFIGAER
jgi:C4-dicarboxylate-specific signal transduction histidine kinase